MDNIKRQSKGEIEILSLRGQVQHDDTHHIEVEFEKILESERKYIVLDLLDVKHISSAALGVIIAAKRRLRKKNGDLRLLVKDGPVKEIIKLTLLDRVFQIYSGKEAAINSFEDDIEELSD